MLAMQWLRRFKFGPRLALLLAAFTVGFLAYGAWTFYTMQKVSVGGPLYQRIEQSQQLVSDVLPPPEFIIESYLTCVQLSQAVSGYKQGMLIDRLKQLQEDYGVRRRVWEQVQFKPELSSALQQAHAPAQAFFDKVNRDLLPALFLNDRTQSERVLLELTGLYELHRKAINQVVLEATRNADENEESAMASVRSARLLQVAILIASLAVVIGLAVLIHRSILQPLSQAVDIAKRVAGGEYQVPVQERYPDEAGTLLTALQDMGQCLDHSVGAMQEARRVAEAASHAKGDFLANMSHEIRTPMNAIIGLSTLALKGDMAPRTQDYLVKIRQSGEHLLGIINDILDFSKIESGKLEVEAVPFELESVIDNVVNLISEKAEAKGLELLCHIDPDIPKLLIGDPLRLGQVLINYANNAVKFTKAGEVRLVVTVRERSDSHVLLHLAVADTGIGLTDEQKSRLFKSFEQADKSTTREYGGSGLGLAISKSLAHAMGGEVGVDSVPGQGSTFWFSARLGVGSAEKAITLPRIDLHGARVLVVDDNEAAAMILSDMLAAIGFAVECADSGPAALQAIQAAEASGTPYEFVMMDWLMPGMDGLETVREIQALHARSAPFVLMVTAHRRQELVKGAELLGIDHVLAKPVNSSLLVNTMMQLMGHSQVQPHVALGEKHSALEETLHRIAGARILLVEDNEINQMVASEMLASVGLHVDVAENGQVAIDRVAACLAGGQPYDLVLMDMQMPVMDGVTASRLIRAAHGDSLPIVAMTANAMKSDRDRCLQAGMNAFVTKPIRPDAVWQVLLTWIQPRDGLGRSAQAHQSAMAEETREDQVLLGALGKVTGLDVNAGLSSSLGNPQFYASMLRKFIDGQADAVSRVVHCLDEGDEAGAELIAHTLKGVSASLGAHRLAHIADGLERCLRTHATPQARLAAAAKTQELLDALVADLRGIPALVPDQASAPALTDAERASALSLLQTIGEWLEDDDARAAELWESHARLLKAVVPFGNEVDAAIRGFDFELALQLLQSPHPDVAPEGRTQVSDRSA
jgi:signal transduction histidine kinase/DNA-binding response OmpR family regulator/HPt (histidine-containing phosphotransfer) domain-containing protein